MKLLIDNLDGRGLLDYSAFVKEKSAKVVRKLNLPAEFTVGLVGVAGSLVVPAAWARVMLTREDGGNLFTGYVIAPPTPQYSGEAERGATCGYELSALSDVALLDQKSPSLSPALVGRTAGEAFRQLTLDTLPGRFDLADVVSGDAIPFFSVDPSKKWTASAAELGVLGRCSYRDDDGKLFLSPLGRNTYSLSDDDRSFSPADLQLRSVDRLVNDLTVLGQLEPSAHVTDYFVGDGFSTTFYLSQIPFARRNEVPAYNRTILDEEYAGLDAKRWKVVDPLGVISVSGGQLQVGGGTGVDGQTLVEFAEKIELGGAAVLEHGDFAFSSASDGVIGGLYGGPISAAGCLAGFRVTASGANCNIQALVNGALTGALLATQPGHHYVFTTRLYPTEVFRMRQVYHSSQHLGGNARGGEAIACDVRAVMEVHDIDPADPATQVAAAKVLYDGVVASPPGFCTYALVDSVGIHCSVAFTYMFLANDALVRSTPEGESTRTRRVGALLDGAECRVSSTPTLQFYPQYIPARNEKIEVTYRSRRRAVARVVDSASIAAHRSGADDGVRGAVRHIASPAARTSADCATAALALLDDAGQGWIGEYRIWNKFLPGGAQDIFPGDGLTVDVPSRSAAFLAIVREVEAGVFDFEGENVRYTLRFVDVGDPSLAFEFGTVAVTPTKILAAVDVNQAGNEYLIDLSSARVTTVTSTTVTVDAGWTPPAGEGIEIRYSDTGWGLDNSRNLIGRFTAGSFTLPRYGRAQNYFLRSYDNSVPPRYSRNSTALHVDYPL